jgi:quercetin dioxygenase-like cupin family protein
MDRRQVLQAGLTALAGAVAGGDVAAAATAQAGGQARPATTSKPLGAHPLGAAFAGWQGTMLEVTYPPGVESAAHQHPGPTFGYVVRGKIRWAIDGGPAQVLEAGQSFFEPLGSVHSTSANASATEPATISVVILGKVGEPLSKPAAKPSGDQ